MVRNSTMIQKVSMLFLQEKIADVWTIEPERFRDSRGSFARTFCRQEFAAHGLEGDFVQHSMSVSARRHTLRGLHFQKAPHGEVKLVSCIRGEIWDVAVDLRPQSPTYLQWVAATLSADNGRQFYIPKGFAHGFLSLTDNATVSYLISAPYVPESASGIRYDEPALGIKWPASPSVVSERDLAWRRLDDEAALSFEIAEA